MSSWNTLISVTRDCPSRAGAIPTQVPLIRMSHSLILSCIRSVSLNEWNSNLHFIPSSIIFWPIPATWSRPSLLLLNTVMDFAPSKAHCTMIAVAAPPAPNKTMSLSTIDTLWSFKSKTTPIPSVIWPVKTPLSLTIVFTAPTNLAASDNLSILRHTSCLHGIVTLAPRMFSRLIAAKESFTWDASVSKAR